MELLRRIQKILFILLLILLPTQLGYHFWPDWAYINGVRIDYFSPTLYVTDILIFLLLILEILNFQFSVLNKFSSKQFSKRLPLYCFIGLLILLNICFSFSPFVTVYKWIKVAEMGALAIWIARNLQFTIHNLKFLLIPIFYESVLAIWQFVNQGSIGGLWYWLGERTFDSATAGIASAVINGQLVLRPYATFPHPNVLMGFLIVAVALFLGNLPHNYRKITALVCLVALSALFLTPSRGDLLKGLNLRLQLNNLAIEHWLKAPMVGTGLGTSPLYLRNITNFALLHQPIHNIYLLLLSETGLVGLGAFLMIIKKGWSWLLAVILFLGLFDHYFLTLQQGQLMLAMVLGLGLRDGII